MWLAAFLLVLLSAGPAWAQVQYDRDTAAGAADKLGMVGCVRKDSAGATVSADNDRAPCMVDANGMLWVTLGTQVQTFTNDPCSQAKTGQPFSFATATTTQLVAASSGNKVYICSIILVTGPTTPNNIALVEDDTAACTSPTAGMAGGTTAATGWVLPASSQVALGNGTGTVLQTAVANRYVCLISSAAVQVSGSIQYVLAP